MDMNRIYLCIDLKSFYASVECVERGLEPMESNLVVADPSRGKGAICLAITPHLKSLGIKNRCRIFEIPEDVDYITAVPRMKKYMEYSGGIYGIYLKYFAKEDIHVYSIDEAFMDITTYLHMYNKTPKELAITIMEDIYETYGIRATAGIGTNLYLAKIALDIIAKHAKDFIGELNETTYQEQLGEYTPLTDFWQIGPGIASHLNRLGIYNMNDIKATDERLLFKEFGINARLLIDHSKGIEPTTIKEIKAYKPKQTSISNTQILFTDYKYEDARKVLIEMLDIVFLELTKINKYTTHIGIYVGYSKDIYKPLSISKRLKEPTNNFQELLRIIIKEYNSFVKKDEKIRRLGISLGGLTDVTDSQLNLFENREDEQILGNTINNIKNKYGKNYVLRGISLDEKATAMKRNKLIGGHNAE